MDSRVRRIPIEDFLRVSSETMFRISRSGERIACLKPYKARLNVFIKNLEGGEDIRVTSCEDRNITDFRWVNEDRIVYFKDNGGDENHRAYAVNIDGSDFKELTPFEGVRSLFVDNLSNNDEILITMNKRDKSLFDVYRVNVYSGEIHEVAQNPGGVTKWIVDYDGNIRCAVELNGVTSKVLYRECANDEFQLVLEGDYKENAIPLTFSKDNKKLIISSNIGRDKYAIYEFDPETKEHTKLLYENEQVDVEQTISSKKNRTAIGAAYVTDKIYYEFFNEEIKDIYTKIKKNLGRDDVLFSDANKKGDKYIVRAYSDKNPGVFYLYDVNNDKLTKIADERPWINEEEMAEMKPISYTSRDGLTINGYLTIPKGTYQKNIPVVIVPHGGPWTRDMWGFKPDVQFLANRGYGVLQINFRASTGYGRKFKEAGFKQWGKTMQDDITDGVNWLIEEGIADKNRVGIYGISYGGYATLAGLTFTPDVYTCGVDVVGPSNIFTLLEGLPTYWEPLRKMMYEMMGDPEQDKELLREASPLFHVENIKKPLFVVQGAKDPRVPQREADQIVEALRERGAEVKYMLKENEGHMYKNQENVIEMYSEVEKFFEKYM